MADQPLRDTDYATEIRHVALVDGDGEVRIERLLVKATGEEEIRFSWQKAGRMIPRPLDLPEPMLVELVTRAARNGGFSNDFVGMLRDTMESAAKKEL